MKVETSGGAGDLPFTLLSSDTLHVPPMQCVGQKPPGTGENPCSSTDPYVTGWHFLAHNGTPRPANAPPPASATPPTPMYEQAPPQMYDRTMLPTTAFSTHVKGSNLTVLRRDLFELIHNKNATREMITDHVLSTLKLNNSPQHVQLHVRQEVSRFYSRCMNRWKQSKRMKDRFLRTNAFWLNIEMKADELVASADRHLADRQFKPVPRKATPPPPPKPKVEDFPKRERNDGGRNLRALPDIPPEEDIPKPKNRPKMSRRNAPVSYTPEEALDNLIVKAKLTKRQYEIMRDYAIGINCFIYPSFSSIQKVMKDRAAAGLPLPQVETEADSDGDIEDSSD